MIRTNNDLGSVLNEGPHHFRDEVINFAGAGTLAAGTILARDSVSLKLVPFVSGGTTNQNGIPRAVLQDPVTATGAGDRPCRPVLGGKVNFNRLIIAADGNNTNVTASVLDQLRAAGIEAENTQQLTKYDN